MVQLCSSSCSAHSYTPLLSCYYSLRLYLLFKVYFSIRPQVTRKINRFTLSVYKTNGCNYIPILSVCSSLHQFQFHSPIILTRTFSPLSDSSCICSWMTPLPWLHSLSFQDELFICRSLKANQNLTLFDPSFNHTLRSRTNSLNSIIFPLHSLILS
jgi:hypothetical protein